MSVFTLTRIRADGRGYERFRVTAEDADRIAASWNWPEDRFGALSLHLRSWAAQGDLTGIGWSDPITGDKYKADWAFS